MSVELIEVEMILSESGMGEIDDREDADWRVTNWYQYNTSSALNLLAYE